MFRSKSLTFAATAFAAALAPASRADDARILAAEARKSGADWTISVTLAHADTGWEDYADGWRVVTADGEVLGTRVLLHPHETEQPFTRGLAGVVIPAGVATVFVEARTLPGGWGTERFPLDLLR